MAHVLVADDDEHILFQVTTILKQRGHTVETAEDGQAAIARATTRAPDLLITDVMMPKMDGWSLVRELRTKHLEMPVIFLTALASEDEKIRAFRLGADDYVIKPFRLDDLAKRVANALDGKRKKSPSLPPPSSGLRGDLAQVGLSTLLVLVEMERKTGVLVLRSSGKTCEAMIRDGKVMRAEMRGGGPVDAECIYQALRWKTGDFDFVAKAVDVPDRIKASTTHLLMEGARLMDEDSQPVKMPPAEAAVAKAPPPPALDDEALAEWDGDGEQRTPMVMAAKLAELVKRTARATLQPLNTAAQGSGVGPNALKEAEAKATDEGPRTSDLGPRPEPPAVLPRPEARGPRPRAPWWMAVLAVIVAGGGTALPMVWKPGGAGDAMPKLQMDVDRLAQAIDSTTNGAKMRAKELATTPLLRAGIETDAATIQDLAKNEALFVPVNGETIEIFQLHDGTPASILRTPASAAALQPASDEGVHVDTDGHAVTIIASALIQKQDTKPGGVMIVARPCDLAGIAQTLGEHVQGAQLVGLAKPVVLVPSKGAGNEVKLPLAKGSPLALSAVIAGPGGGGQNNDAITARYAAWGTGGALLLLFLVLAVRRR